MVAAPARTVGTPIRVGLVSAYPTVRAGLRSLLSSDPSIEVLTEAATLGDLEAEPGPAIDVLVLDLDASAGWQLAAYVLDLPIEVGLVLLGPESGEFNPATALDGRAWAQLLKEAGALELSRAVAAVDAGLIVVQPPLLRRLTSPGAGMALAEDSVETLTAREHEVLQLVAQGLPNKTIALRLGISEHTVKFHVTSILGKLGAASRTEAVRLGARRGLIIL